MSENGGERRDRGGNTMDRARNSVCKGGIHAEVADEGEGAKGKVPSRKHATGTGGKKGPANAGERWSKLKRGTELQRRSAYVGGFSRGEKGELIYIK